jgi:hypothetical protein
LRIFKESLLEPEWGEEEFGTMKIDPTAELASFVFLIF